MTSASLREHSYFQTGGSCDDLIIPTSADQVCEALKKLSQNATPYFVLGGGTNSLVSDEHWRGAVIVLTKLNELTAVDSSVQVGAGVENTTFAKFAHLRSLSGAEWMNRLPGRMGGTVRMNARCYGGEISQIVHRVFTVSPRGEKAVWLGKEVFRGYKDTAFMTNRHLVVGCDIELMAGNQANIAARMKHCEDDRVAKHQFEYPSCGCIFKNNYKVGVPSGVLLEGADAKLLSVGGASVSSYHANFVFNKGSNSREILELTLLMREAVWQKYGVWLEYEMEVLGILPKDLQSKFLEVRKNQPNQGLLSTLKTNWLK